MSFNPRTNIPICLGEYVRRQADLRRLRNEARNRMRGWHLTSTHFFPPPYCDGLIVATDRQLNDWSSQLWDAVTAQVLPNIDPLNWHLHEAVFKEILGQLFGTGWGSPAFLWTTFAKPPASFGMRRAGIKPTYGPRRCEKFLPSKPHYWLPVGLGRPELRIPVRRRPRDVGILWSYAGQYNESETRPLIHGRAKYGRDAEGRELSYGQHWELNLATPDDRTGLASETGTSSLGEGFLKTTPVVHQHYLSLTCGVIHGERWDSTLYAMTWTLHPEGAVTFGINCNFGPLGTFLIQYPSLTRLLAEYLGIDPDTASVM